MLARLTMPKKIWLTMGVALIVGIACYFFLPTTPKVRLVTPSIQPYLAEDAMRDYMKRVHPSVLIDEVNCELTASKGGLVMCRAEGSNRGDGRVDVIIALCKDLGTPTDQCG